MEQAFDLYLPKYFARSDPGENTMKHPRFFLLIAAVVIIAVVNASAQSSDSQASSTSHVTYTLGMAPAGILVFPKAGAPFSGVLIEQYEQTLEDGTRISREDHEVIMRDGLGRIYRSRPVHRVGSAEGAAPQMITITDPVAHLQYFCSPFRKVCSQMRYQAPAKVPRPHVTDNQVTENKKGRDITVEDLGTSNIGGVDVVGKQITRVIPEGMLGNDRPLTTVEELWRSDELDVDIQTKRTDPRTGTHTTTMTEVNLGEPEARYFQIPEGYRVEERPNPFGAAVAAGTADPAATAQVPLKNQ
jgi:hypothetical protein